MISVFLYMIFAVPIVAYLVQGFLVGLGNGSRIAWASVAAMLATALSGAWMASLPTYDLLTFLAGVFVVIEVIAAGVLVLLYGKLRSDRIRDKRVIAWVALTFALLTSVFNVLGGIGELRSQREEACMAIKYGPPAESSTGSKGC